MTTVEERLREAVAQLHRGYGGGYGGHCWECPFSSKPCDRSGRFEVPYHEIANDPTESYNRCNLPGRDNREVIWGEYAPCSADEWQRGAIDPLWSELLALLDAQAQEIAELKAENATLLFRGTEQAERIRAERDALAKERDAAQWRHDETCKALEISQKQTRTVEIERDALAKSYNELIFAVGNKWPHQTRHETALAYIKAVEAIGSNDPQTDRASTRDDTKEGRT